ncbi:hypothetical protein PM082_017763 [Marasmius tenuissimus]|nr:hypothetical protein PM082_017763 [Marasmius tenuissimus]
MNFHVHSLSHFLSTSNVDSDIYVSERPQPFGHGGTREIRLLEATYVARISLSVLVNCNLGSIGRQAHVPFESQTRVPEVHSEQFPEHSTQPTSSR